MQKARTSAGRTLALGFQGLRFQYLGLRALRFRAWGLGFIFIYDD